MRIGINCFKDIQLRSIIQSEHLIGHCDIKNDENVPIYDSNRIQSNDMEANISSILSLYASEDELIDNGRQTFDKIENKLYSDWNIFSSEIESQDIRRIVLAICANEYDGSELIFKKM